MRFASIICLTLSICGCSPTAPTPPAPPPVATPPPAPPPAPPAPAPPPSNMASLWGIVVDPSGVCIEGATVEVVGGRALLGQRVLQITPCDHTRFTGGFEFDNVPLADVDEMILRASAPGYVSREKPAGVPWDGTNRRFTLVPTGR